MITELLGGLLQLLTVASLVAAATAFLLGLGKAQVPGAPLHDMPSMDWKKTLLWAAAMTLGSRLALVLLAYLGLAAANAFGSEDVKLLLAGYGFDKPFPPMESMFSRWDAPHYLDIARFGYTSDQTTNGGEQHWFIVFYPLYPALAALLKPLFGSVFSAGTVVSWLSLTGAAALMIRLAAMDGNEAQGRRAVKYLMVFPAAVFLGAPYTESLFLLLTALCLWALRRQKWWLAGLMGFFAALTRNLGLLLVVPFAVEILDALGVFQEPRRLATGRFWLDFLLRGAWMLLIPAGAAVYLLINQIAYGDPFAFLQIQANHWGQKMQAPWLTVKTTWENLVGDGDSNLKLYLWGPQLAGMLAMLAALPFLMRKLRPAWAAYLLVYTIVALTPAWLLSFNRYMMGAVPLFLGLAALTEKRKTADWIVTILFAAAMLFLAAGYLMWRHVV